MTESLTPVGRLAKRLVAIESVNPSLVSGGTGEAEISSFIRGWLAERGAEVHWLESTPGRPSVVGVFRGEGGGPSLMLNGHIDTVDLGGHPDAIRPRIDGDRLYGRGAYDMKGSVAAMMVAASRAAEVGLAGDVVVACVADEEHASLGSTEVASGFVTDAAIVTEPTELQLVVAHKGFVWAEIETRGRAAHGSRPDLGVDAIAHMGRVLNALEATQDAMADGEAHRYLGTGSVHASTIDGGDEWSTYPSRCRLRVEWRTLPGETPAMIESRLRDLLDSLAASDPCFDATLRLDLDRPPHETPVDSPIARAVRRAATDVLGTEPKIAGAAYWADCALLAAAGIDTVMFGAEGHGAHGDDEWVSLASLDRCAETLEAVTLAFCGRHESASTKG